MIPNAPIKIQFADFSHVVMIPLRDKIVTKMTIIVMVIKAMITSLSWRESPTSE